MEKKTIEISWVKSFSENKGAQGTLSVAQVFADDDWCGSSATTCDDNYF